VGDIRERDFVDYARRDIKTASRTP
jgi:hypothetical protein